MYLSSCVETKSLPDENCSGNNLVSIYLNSYHPALSRLSVIIDDNRFKYQKFAISPQETKLKQIGDYFPCSDSVLIKFSISQKDTSFVISSHQHSGIVLGITKYERNFIIIPYDEFPDY